MGFPFEHGLHATLIAMRLGDRLGVDRATASQTYYACLLSHAGCTTDAHIAAEIFGGSMTMEFHPVMYGSGREAMLGILRALSEPDRTAPVRAFQVATRLPRLARMQRRETAASCTWPKTRRYSVCWGAQRTRCASSASAPDLGSNPDIAACLADHADEIL